MSTVISTKNLTRRYRSTAVLNDLDLNVPEASVFGFVGPNGAGKTTTIKILMNIIQPSAGSAEVLGRDTRKLSPADLTRIGYVSENQELPEWMTVEYFLAYLKPFYPDWDDSRAAELLRMFDLPRERRLSELSRGMRMKAALVSALAYRPRLLVLDEPFSGLDPLVREDLIEGLLESASETTIFISSHDLADIESFASHIGYLDRGRLHFSEDMTSLSARFREIEVTVEPPAPDCPLPEWPTSWLRPQTSNALVRFVETRFEPEHTTAEIRRLFGNVRYISVNPMSLRAIFITLARNVSRTA
ncbi:MAG: ABC transporter ATP-binding protein [Bryobacteraceae bacterium]|nr:ABC transporter ATP-binding protein [Bryobacteraceae bacterium]